MSDALVVDRVSKRYGERWAVRNLSFTARGGSILGFLGPNGAGKTSTLRMILGLSAPTEGRIEVLGSRQVRAVRDRIGFLPEERGLYRRLTPVEAIVFFGRLKGLEAREARRRAEQLLADNGLADAARRPVKALSKGMAQKVQLLSAVVHRPDLVLLDEPFSGLDPVNQQSLEALIRGLADAGATVVFSTHVMQHAERLCDQVVLIAEGRKVFDGDVAAARAAAPRRLVLEGALDAAVVAGLPGVAGPATAEPLEDGFWRTTAVLRPGAGQETLRAAFDTGRAIRSLEVKEPSLHDAFIVLTSGERAA